ncbi:MAG: response regulator [Flavobacteriales bacterium]|nr:response regulator [Flavobacteriales bacterium]
METKILQVIIIDDDWVFLQLIHDQITQRLNADVRLFTSTEDCLKAKHINPDFIFLDYHLEGSDEYTLDGFQSIEKLKKKYPYNDIIMISGKEDLEYLSKCLEYGASDYLAKSEFTASAVQFIIQEKYYGLFDKTEPEPISS